MSSKIEEDYTDITSKMEDNICTCAKEKQGEVFFHLSLLYLGKIAIMCWTRIIELRNFNNRRKQFVVDRKIHG